MSRIIDISQPLGRATATWPGDTRFESFWVMRQDRGDSCNVGSVTMSLHTATHMDAPLHFLQNAAGADGIDLTACVGPALLVDLQGVREVLPEHLSTVEPGLMERVLLKTGTARYDRFEPDFGCLSEAAACRLAECGVRLVGIDTPSVDRSDSKSLGTHRVLAGAGIVILENLRLDDVGPGIYELIALPLRLEEMDASPVRAILRTIGDP